jgi:hypothetical protein
VEVRALVRQYGPSLGALYFDKTDAWDPANQLIAESEIENCEADTVEQVKNIQHIPHIEHIEHIIHNT